MKEITLDDVYLAYKKYKSYIYYDTTDLLNRAKIAEFESSDYTNRLTKLFDIIVNKEYDKFNYYVEQIKRYSLPKTIDTDNNNEIIKNFDSNRAYIKKKINYIDAPIEVHIVSVLWIMRKGIEISLGERLKFCYGNILDLDENNELKGLKLFKPYYSQYTLWRDNAIEVAKKALKANQDVAIISLDIADFYSSVRHLTHYGGYIDNFMGKIYTYCHGNDDEHYGYSLPIGLLSSSVLANIYLADFDKNIDRAIRPLYYGRYVDDILIVIPMANLNKYKAKKDFLKSIFKDILEEMDDGSFKLKNYNNAPLYIQEEKTKIMLFDKNEPDSILDKFKETIQKQSSEYRFLPDEKILDKTFNDFATKIIYEDSHNKLRDIKEFQNDKFAISSFLTKKIFLALQDNSSDQKSANQIVSFFKGTKAIKYISLWEKVFTFLVINNNTDTLLKCKKNIISSIDTLSPEAHLGTHEMNVAMKEFLHNSISLAISLRINEYKHISIWNEYIELAIQFRDSKMLRKHYAKSILTELANKDKNKYLNLMDFKTHFDVKSESFVYYSYYPRFIHFHEILLAYYIHQIETANIESDKNNIEKVYNELNNIFLEINNNPHRDNGNNGNIIFDQDNSMPTVRLRSKSKDKLRIGLANININDEIFTHQYIRSPNIEPSRRIEMNKILNQAIIENVELLVLPECSIPYEWLHWIVDFAYRNKIGMVFGLEHIVRNNKAYNLLVTLLPADGGVNNQLFIDIRLKKYYSPEENRVLKGYGFEIPSTTRLHTLYKWHDIHFTAFNCYELTNIEDRARYKSKIDMLVACEYNKDVKYFSNIIGSTARDLHCYCIQSNNAKYGDNLIYQPTSSISSHIVRLKGGENSTILVGTVDISKLREFQILNYDLQRDEKFKPTPPDFNQDEVRDRMNDN